MFPDALRWQAVAFMRVEWPFIFGGSERFLEHPYPLSMEQTHFAIVEGDVLMSYATLVRMEQWHDGETYDMLGLGNVFTFPPYRREGLARQVIAAATEHLRASDADIGALLCGDNLVPMYSAAGWTAAHAPTHEGTADAAKPLEAVRMMLLVSPRAQRASHSLLHTPMYVAGGW
jgi:predicted acetyltransferase